MGDLLTGRQLVAELQARGVGRWSTAMVRRWIHEEPPCPVAEYAAPGQSHRYQADAVIAWLRSRDERLGITRAPIAPAGTVQADNKPVPQQPQPAAADKTQALLARAENESAYSETVELVLGVLKGRDPRNWKAAEEAYTTRLKRLEMQGHLVDVDDMRHCLDLQQQIFSTATNALRSQLKLAMADALDRSHRESAIDQEIDLMLDRIADAADSAMPEESHHAA